MSIQQARHYCQMTVTPRAPHGADRRSANALSQPEQAWRLQRQQQNGSAAATEALQRGEGKDGYDGQQALTPAQQAAAAALMVVLKRATKDIAERTLVSRAGSGSRPYSCRPAQQ